MKLWIMSDLHFEFHPDEGERFLEELPDVNHDIAIIAGDLSDFMRIPTALRLVGARFKEVLYVIGNHECYGGTIEEARDRAVGSSPKNVTVVECGEHRGILACSLWFPYDPKLPSRGEQSMNDFFQIRAIRETVGEENARAVRFLEERVGPGSIVVTHHLPSYGSVHPKYAGSPLNRFFVGSADHVFENRPALWIHGHTHESVDYVVGGETRVVCNPYGYHRYEVNPTFNPALVIEVDS